MIKRTFNYWIWINHLPSSSSSSDSSSDSSFFDFLPRPFGVPTDLRLPFPPGPFCSRNQTICNYYYHHYYSNMYHHNQITFSGFQSSSESSTDCSCSSSESAWLLVTTSEFRLLRIFYILSDNWLFVFFNIFGTYLYVSDGYERKFTQQKPSMKNRRKFSEVMIPVRIINVLDRCKFYMENHSDKYNPDNEMMWKRHFLL